MHQMVKQMYNIAFGALGSSISLNKQKLKRSNGTLEYYKYLKTLCAIPNIDNIYLLSTSDYNSISGSEIKDIDPYNKLRIIWDEQTPRPAKKFKELCGYDMNALPNDVQERIQKETKYSCVGEVQQESSKMIKEKLSGVKIDQIILYMSQGVSNWNVPNAKMTKFGTGNQSMVMSVNYSSPIVQYMNENQDIPYYLILPDPRWGGKENWGLMIDNFKTPDAVLTQYDSNVTWRHVTEYDSTKTTKEFEYKYDTVKFKYKETEKVSSIGVKPTDPNNDRFIEFAIVAMQSRPEKQWKDDYRFKELKAWILDKNLSGSWHIYGNWSPEVHKKYSHFKGMIPSELVDEKFKNTKYTLIIPIAKNWVTGKYVEMIATGVVTFFHPDYDKQYHVVPKDHFIRVASTKELNEKIKYLNEFPEERIKLVKQLQEKIFRNVINGHVITDMLNETNKEHQIDLQFDYPKFKKPKKNKLLSLFV